MAKAVSPAAHVIVRKHRFRKQNRRRGKTRRRHLLFSVMALGPSLVLAEVAGSRVLSTIAVAPPPLFASPALPAADATVRSADLQVGTCISVVSDFSRTVIVGAGFLDPP